jgi:hypothetical protein
MLKLYDDQEYYRQYRYSAYIAILHYQQMKHGSFTVAVEMPKIASKNSNMILGLIALI